MTRWLVIEIPLSLKICHTSVLREADEHLDHAIREGGRPAPDYTLVGYSCGLIGVIIKQSLLERASDLVLYRKVIDYSTAASHPIPCAVEKGAPFTKL